jgi:ribonuclease-3
MRLRREHGELERRIGYRFRNQDLLREALTHRSYRFERSDVAYDNERLEFLGDAILSALTAAHVFCRYTDRPEGDLTALRSRMTSGTALSECAADLALGHCLRMGQGEERSGGRRRPSNLANALEALLGAAFIDGGMRAASRIFESVLAPRVAAIEADPGAGNPKGKLQELSQARWKSAPVYRLIGKQGPAHAAEFTVSVSLPDGRSAKADGRSKQSAEARAAELLLETLANDEVEPPAMG